jgi:hypothetical protein
MRVKVGPMLRAIDEAKAEVKPEQPKPRYLTIRPQAVVIPDSKQQGRVALHFLATAEP